MISFAYPFFFEFPPALAAGFGSTDALLSYLEKLRITIAANQSSCGKIPDAVTALNLTFSETVV